MQPSATRIVRMAMVRRKYVQNLKWIGTGYFCIWIYIPQTIYLVRMPISKEANNPSAVIDFLLNYSIG